MANNQKPKKLTVQQYDKADAKIDKALGQSEGSEADEYVDREATKAINAAVKRASEKFAPGSEKKTILKKDAKPKATKKK